MMFFDSLDACGPVSRDVTIPIADHLHNAYDIIVKHEGGCKQFVKVGDSYYVNAEALDTPVDNERISWYRRGMAGDADMDEIGGFDFVVVCYTSMISCDIT